MPRLAAASPELARALRRQDAVVTLEQVTQGGISRRTADKRVRRGAWLRLLPGIYLACPSHPTRRQLLVAAWLWGGPGAAVDGPDALAAWHGFSPPNLDPRRVHIVTPSTSEVRSRDFVVVRRAVAEIEVARGSYVPFVDAATALIVTARGASSVDAAVDVMSRALQKGVVTVPELDAARERLGDKWCRRLDQGLAAVRMAVRSPAEKWLYDLWSSSRLLPEPAWNVWVDLGDGGREVQLDTLIDRARLVNEVNGKENHAWCLQFEKTSERHERLTAAGLVVLQTSALRIRRQPSVVLRGWERAFVRYDGSGLPPNVRIVDPPRWWQDRIAGYGP